MKEYKFVKSVMRNGNSKSMLVVIPKDIAELLTLKHADKCEFVIKKV